jgi:hypothetical protein
MEAAACIPAPVDHELQRPVRDRHVLARAGLKKRTPVRSSLMITGDAPAGAGANVSTAMKTAVANAPG